MAALNETVGGLAAFLNAIQTARGSKETTTRSQNVSAEQAQAMMAQQLAGNGGLRDIIAAHRSTGLRSSSGQQASVENLMAKIATNAALASTNQTDTKQVAGVTRGNEAKYLSAIAALYPAGKKAWDAASDYFDTSSGAADFSAEVSPDMVAAYDTWGTLGTSGADEAVSFWAEPSADMVSAFDMWGTLGSSGVAEDVGSSIIEGAARGGLITNTGASQAPQAPVRIRVTPTLSNYSDGSRSFGNYGAAAPSNVTPDGFVPGFPEYTPFAPTLQQFIGNLAKAAVNPVAKNVAMDAPVTPFTVLNYFLAVAKLNDKDSAKNKADQFEAAFKNEMQFKHENPDYAMPVEAEQAVNNADVSNIGYTNAGAGAGYTGGGPGASIGGGWGNSGGFGPADSGASGDSGTSTAAKGGSVAGDSKPGVDDSLVALDGGEYVIPADVVSALGVDQFDKLLSAFGYKPRRVKGVPI
jgi:hypothetical protein